MNQKKLTNKIAIITGASSGIGRATALALARRGYRVGLAARNLDALLKLQHDIQDIGAETLPVQADVTKPDQVRSMVDTVINRWGQIDILVSGAGQYIRSPTRLFNIEELEKSMAVNFYGGVYAIYAVLPYMLKRHTGHILLVSSLDGKIALINDAPYVSAKFALNGFGATLRQELASSGIDVSLILPGRVDTPMIQELTVPWISAKIPPEAVADAIVKTIRHPRPEVILPAQAGLLYYISVFSPHLSDWLAKKLHLEGWSA
jgi:short-subunit dehydrogenase